MTRKCRKSELATGDLKIKFTARARLFFPHFTVANHHCLLSFLFFIKYAVMDHATSTKAVAQLNRDSIIINIA